MNHKRGGEQRYGKPQKKNQTEILIPLAKQKAQWEPLQKTRTSERQNLRA
jgi:hypothetical protein